MNFCFLVLPALIHLITCQNPSPCPNVFEYEKNTNEIDRWNGNINIPSTKNVTLPLRLQITLDRPADLLGSWAGPISSKDNMEFTIRNNNYTFKAGIKQPIKIFVKYNPAEIIPSIKVIRFNGKSICPEEDERTYNLIPNPIKISDSIRPNGSLKNEETGGKPFKGDFYWFNRSDNLSSLAQTNTKSLECGVVLPRANALIINGYEALPGQWPWHAALYRPEGIKLEYFCGGTLISSQHILTAAHCVTLLHTKELVNPHNILVSLGRNSLQTFGEELQDRTVSVISVHQEYDPDVLFNDIAVIKLSKPVELTNSVHPCCLWDEDTNLANIIGKQGTVVGWGFDNNNKLSNRLMQASMPVVSTDDCLYSHRNFFSQFKFKSNYCAGFLNGTSVCIGDSGGGMVFPKTGATGQSTVWQIRGVVSIGVASQHNIDRVCDTSQYALFTDVAMYTPWIQGLIIDPAFK